MRVTLLILALLSAAPLAAQEDEALSRKAPEPDYSPQAIRSILLQVQEEQEARDARDPFKQGWPLFSFRIGGSSTTVRFMPFGVPMAMGSGVEINPIVNPLDMTGTGGSALSPRLRNRYQEWWISRRLGFPLSPPKE